ncbi:Uncharacterised protein [Actinobacillus pleuropneumoniae]|nr:Uncharacterised protein [Actinobacillus pleuropneumoniae]
MLKHTETVTVKYKPHGILKKLMKLNVEEGKQVFDCWSFESEDFSIDFGDSSLIHALEELSIEGWELVCHSEQEGFIFRKKEEEETTIDFYEEDDVINEST